MTDRFPSGIDHYDFGDELSRLERASRFHEWTKNLFDEGPHLVSCPELPWGDEVRQQSIEAYRRFIHGETWITGGGAREMEAEIVSWMGGILGATEPAGFVTSGGSESNMCAILAARERAGVTQGGSLVYPANAHYSVPKLCRMFGLEPIVVPSLEGSHFEVDLEAYAAAIRSDTIALFTTAGTWAYGTVDPIEAIGEIAVERDLHLHVDGAFGGYILPFLERSGYDPEIPRWDFRVPGVSTISADLHKNGMAPPPAGTLFFRDADLLEHAKAVCPPNGTMTGTRGTGPIAGAWTMVKLLGDEGYQAVSLKSIALRDELVAGRGRHRRPVGVPRLPHQHRPDPQRRAGPAAGGHRAAGPGLDVLGAGRAGTGQHRGRAHAPQPRSGRAVPGRPPGRHEARRALRRGRGRCRRRSGLPVRLLR